MTRQASLQSGRVIDERFTLEAPARGPGIGESWKALGADGTRVRLKFLTPPEGLSTAAFLEQVQTLARVHHANVVEVRAGGVWGDRPYLVVDEGPDATLEDWLDELRANRKQPDLEVARKVIDAILAGVSAAHATRPAPVPHQALAPATVIVDRDDRDVRSVAVSDAGIVAYDAIGRERLDVLPGFTEYLAPEQLKGDLGTPASDVFALGVLIVEIFTTRSTAAKPWSRLAREGNVRGRLGSLRADVPGATWDVLARALHAAPTERFATALELSLAWKQAWGDEPELSTVVSVEAAAPTPLAASALPPMAPAGPVVTSEVRRSSPLFRDDVRPGERPASSVFDALASERAATSSSAFKDAAAPVPTRPAPPVPRPAAPGPPPPSLARPAAPTVMSMQSPVPGPTSATKLSPRAAAPTVMSMQSPVLAPPPPTPAPKLTPRAAAPTVTSMQSPVVAPPAPLAGTPASKLTPRAAAPTVMSMQSPVLAPAPSAPSAAPRVSTRAAAPTVTSMQSPAIGAPLAPLTRASAPTVTNMQSPEIDALRASFTDPMAPGVGNRPDEATGEIRVPEQASLDDEGPPTQAIAVVATDASVFVRTEFDEEDSPTSAVMPAYDPVPDPIAPPRASHAARAPAPDPYVTSPVPSGTRTHAAAFTNTMPVPQPGSPPSTSVAPVPPSNSRRIILIVGAAVVSVLLGVVLARWLAPPAPPSRPVQDGAAPTTPSSTPLPPPAPVENVAVAGAHACPVGMVHIDPGGFVPIRNADEARATGAPPVRVGIGEMCVDRTEVTELALTTCQRAGACGAASTSAQSAAFSPEVVRVLSTFCSGVDPSRMQRPANCIDQIGAARFCGQRHARLPTEDEWEYIAGAGSPEARYPWGADDPDPSRVNGCGLECRALPAVLGVTRALYPQADPWVGPADVGVLGAGASPFHVLDLAGNVWEWTDGSIGSPPPNPEEALHAVRGGGWLDTESEALRVASRRVFRADTRLPQVGFRCVVSFDRR